MEPKHEVLSSQARPSGKSYATTWKSVEAVAGYAQKRYRNLDQRLISTLELHHVKKLLQLLRTTDLIIVDVPAGYGRFTSLLQAQARKLINVDLNLYALQYQKSHLKPAPPVLIANVKQLPFRTGYCELIFNFRLLQHLRDLTEQLAILKELQRVTSRYVILSVYHPTRFHRLTQIINPQTGKMNMIPKNIWLTLLKEAGLEVIEYKRVLPLLHAQHIYLLRKVEPN